MNTNMGKTDRMIRFLIAVVITMLYFLGKITGTAAVVGLTMALVLMITSTIRYCPLYAPFHFSTIKKKKIQH